jgi:putative ABC transport system substrate-binding protein
VKRRTFIAGLGSAVAFPLAALAQQPERMRRIGVLVNGLAADDPEWQIRGTAFVQGLQEPALFNSLYMKCNERRASRPPRVMR